MRHLIQGGKCDEGLKLLLSLTSISSEDVKAALHDHLVKGLSDTLSAQVNGVALPNFNRALNRLEEAEQTVERLIELRMKHLKSVK